MLRKIGLFIVKAFCWLLVALVVLLLLIDRFIQFRMDDKELGKYFETRQVSYRISTYPSHNRNIRYVQTGVEDSAKATIIFIHGAPSSSSYWKAYLSDSTLLKKATMFAVDRPGYGYSGLGEPLADIQAQAAVIRPILDSLHHAHHPIIIVGASYGSPIACRIAMDYPSLADGLVLVAPPLGPGQERIFWFSPMIENPLLNWVVPRMLQSANKEKLHHREDLDAMLNRWSSIHIPVSYLQGTNDELVYPSNAAFARTHLTGVSSLDIQMIPGRGHLIAFNEKDRITKAILDVLNKADSTHK